MAKSEAGTPAWAVFTVVSALSAITVAISWLVNMRAAITTQEVQWRAAITTQEAQWRAAIETEKAQAEALVWKTFFELASFDRAAMTELLNAAAAAKKRHKGSGSG